MTVTFEDIDMGVRYTHSNGRTLEVVGEQDSGEWFCCEGNGDDSECYAQGYSERDGDADVMTDTEGNEVARLEGEADWEQWAEKMLA